MRYSPALVLAAALAHPLPAAADLAADFARLLATHPDLSFKIDPGDQVQQAEAMLKSLVGRWVIAPALMGNTTDFPPPDLLAKACEKLGWDISLEGDLSAKMSLTHKEGVLDTHLQYAGGQTFLFSFDEMGMRKRLFGDSEEGKTPNMLYSALVRSRSAGFFTLFPSGRDLILVFGQGTPPDMWVRCQS